MGIVQTRQKSHSFSLRSLRTDDNEEVSSPSSKIPIPNITKNLLYIDLKYNNPHPIFYNTSENESEEVSYPTSKQPPQNKIKPCFARQFQETSHNTQSKTLQLDTLQEDEILAEHQKRQNHHFGRLMTYGNKAGCKYEEKSPKDTFHSLNSHLHQDNFSFPSSQSDIGEFFVSMTNIMQKPDIETGIRPRSWTKGILKQRSDKQDRQSKHIIGKEKPHVRFQEIPRKRSESRYRAISESYCKPKPQVPKNGKKKQNRKEDKISFLSPWVK